MAAGSSFDALVGRRLGRYRIDESLGRGGMAEVFRATDGQLDREVAVKVVLPAHASDEAFLARFLREARVVASLEHPNILPIYDFGEHEGLPFLVMPLVRGGTLADRMDGRPLDPAQAAVWVGELAAALDAAHAAGVLHRDVKPGNVLIGGDDRLFLADFGIARLFDSTRLTRTGTVVGTPLYMAPEVAAGRPASERSDGYSLAVLAYEMLAGRPPFEGDNALSVLHQHATRPVPPITSRVGHLGAGVDAALERGLAKDPAERPVSCRTFADLLAGQVSREARPVSVAPASDHLPTVPLPKSSSAAVPMTGTPAAGTPAAGTPAAGTPAVTPPSGEAYATVHAPAGPGQLRQWAAAGALGAVVAVAGFVALKTFEREPAQDVTAAGKPAPAAEPATTVDAPTPEPATPEPMPAAPEPDDPVPAAAPADLETGAPADLEPDRRAAPAASLPPPRDRPAAADPAVDAPPPARPAAPTRRQTPRTDGDTPAAQRFGALRSFTTRSTASDFERARQAAERLSRRGSKAAQARALERYGEGGLAYLRNDDAAAAEALRAALENRMFVVLWGPSPLMLLASERDRRELAGWEVALGYGDARHEAGAELDRLLLAEPQNPRYRFARALVHRLDGEHPAVIRNAAPVFHQLEHGEAPEAESYLALVIADAYAEIGHGDDAIEWYRKALAAGGPFRGVVAMRAAETARRLHRLEVAADFLQAACDAGLRPACEKLRASARIPDRR